MSEETGSVYKRMRVEDLASDPANVRKHSDANLRAIRDSLRRFGQQKPIVVDGNGVVRAGNGTLMAAQLEGWDELDVVISDLEGAEATAYAIADNRTAELAEWDQEALIEQLDALGAEDPQLPEQLGFTEDDIADLVDGLELGEEEKVGSGVEYTAKVQIPIYEPKGDRPTPGVLYDNEKARKLISEIEAADLDPEVEMFLRNAASRHIVFDYSAIAEFYAHADEQTQRLMEKSALVIIDFNQAVEEGFVRMTTALREAFVDDIGTEE